MRSALLAVVLSACYARGPIGPYVRSISRAGNVLVIDACTIVLEDDDDLRFESCTRQQIPLPPRAQ
jgi:hypothetical protein